MKKGKTGDGCDLQIQRDITGRIFTIRGVQVMVDRDLATLYGVDTRVLNQSVRRNIGRFPEEFRFQPSHKEIHNLRSQFVISSEHGGRRYRPYVFTEQGIAMLSAVLRSDTAIKVSIQIMQAFVDMRKFIASNGSLFHRMDTVEQKLIESDHKFEELFSALESNILKPEEGIFYDGEVFDAYVFVADLIKSAKHSIVIIDNFIDETVLQLLTKRGKTVTATLYTKSISRTLSQDLERHNSQYEPVTINTFNKAHDRFLIIDETTVYHFGASLKDLGKKWFAFSKMQIEGREILERLKG